MVRFDLNSTIEKVMEVTKVTTYDAWKFHKVSVSFLETSLFGYLWTSQPPNPSSILRSCLFMSLPMPPFEYPSLSPCHISNYIVLCYSELGTRIGHGCGSKNPLAFGLIWSKCHILSECPRIRDIFLLKRGVWVAYAWFMHASKTNHLSDLTYNRHTTSLALIQDEFVHLWSAYPRTSNENGKNSDLIRSYTK